MHTSPLININTRSTMTANSALTATTGFAADTSFNDALRDANASLNRNKPAVANVGHDAAHLTAQHAELNSLTNQSNGAESDEPVFRLRESTANARFARLLPHTLPKTRTALPGSSGPANVHDAVKEIFQLLPPANTDSSLVDLAISKDALGLSGAAESKDLTPSPTNNDASLVGLAIAKDATGLSATMEMADGQNTSPAIAASTIAATDPKAAAPNSILLINAGSNTLPQKPVADARSITASLPTSMGYTGNTSSTSTASRLLAGSNITPSHETSRTDLIDEPVVTTGKENADVIDPAIRNGGAENKLSSIFQTIDAISRSQKSFETRDQNASVVQAGFTIPSPPTSTNASSIQSPTEVVTQLGQPGWANELGSAVIKLTGRNIAEAKLKLNPEHLGPIEVVIDMQAGAASVSFVAATPEARQALEQSLPQLAQMLSDAGLSLAQSSVGQGAPKSNGDMAGSLPKSDRTPADQLDAHSQEIPVTRHVRAQLGGIDIFA